MPGRHGIFGPDSFDDHLALDRAEKDLQLLEAEINSFIAAWKRKHGDSYKGKLDVPLNPGLLSKIGNSGKRKLVRVARKSEWVIAKIIQREGTEYLHLEE